MCETLVPCSTVGGPLEQQLQDVAPRSVCDHVEDVRHVHRLVGRLAQYHDGGLDRTGNA